MTETTEQRRRRLATRLDSSRGPFHRWMKKEGYSQEQCDQEMAELDKRVKEMSGE